MASRKTKKEIVKQLLNADIDEKDEEELLDLLVDQPISIDVDKEEERKKTKGDIIADKISEVAGSWNFIIVFVLFLTFWIIFNTITGKNAPDGYPFILLNLVLSCISALQAPIIMMSQNRQGAKDSLRDQNDYRTDLKSELILEELHIKIEKILKDQKEIKKALIDNGMIKEDDKNEEK